MKIYALHGFLGKPSDWSDIAPPDIELDCIDLFHEPIANSIADWVAGFNERVSKDRRKKVLLGYSLGGRLALHSLLAAPKLWDGAIIVSAHPGIVDNNLRKLRYEEDVVWSEYFRTKPWNLLMQEWNRRPIFDGGVRELHRNESDYERTKLSAALVNWSLGKQQDLRPVINHLDLPILWVNGANDHLYCKQVEGVALKHPKSQKIQIEAAGHRVPWDNAVHFFEKIREYMKLFNTEVKA